MNGKEWFAQAVWDELPEHRKEELRTADIGGQTDSNQ